MKKMRPDRVRPALIVVTGTPGTGKTSVSRLLAKRIGATHIDLSALVKEKNLIQGVDEKRDTLIVDIEKTNSYIKKLVDEADVPVILEGHYAHNIVSPEEDAIIFVLRRAPWILKKELEDRDYNETKVWENLEAEIMGVCLSEALDLHPELKICEIDTTKLDLKNVASIIESILEGHVRCKGGFLDWITHAETLKLLESKRCI